MTTIPEPPVPPPESFEFVAFANETPPPPELAIADGTGPAPVLPPGFPCGGLDGGVFPVLQLGLHKVVAVAKDPIFKSLSP